GYMSLILTPSIRTVLIYLAFMTVIKIKKTPFVLFLIVLLWGWEDEKRLFIDKNYHVAVTFLRNGITHAWV
ncbi:hypothetical protein, partial [Serratia ureilytica]|uniref:hypothetical protein n=1 Tax=Serratia ureilytica TaxID=300181 RepID=UPI003FA700C3